MRSLVWCDFLGLVAFANICGVRGDEGQPQSTALTATSNASPTTALGSPSGSLPATTGTATSIGTCPSRTINYITHTLAQQCLRADWSRSRGSNATSSGSSMSVSGSTNITTTEGITSTTPEIATEVSTASTSSIDQPTATAAGIIETEVDSALDNANFLSFEDWKKQNLAKVGQSSDNFGNKQQFEPGRRQANVNALDSLGEESEINLDFVGFGGASVNPKTQSERFTSSTSVSSDDTEVSQTSPASQALRPRDAGKTCKERTNYASFDCAATVLKSNKECKSAGSVLVENKDSYMLNKCSASNKYLIVELCNDILVDTVVLANYEFFSSIFRTFRVSVSDRYPAKAEKWKDLGTFEARNTREVQAFLIENPLIWARYLRIEFLTHYGSEYYCPLSLLRVHGTTMMEEFRNQEELARGEPQDEDSIVETVDTVGTTQTAVSLMPELSVVDKHIDVTASSNDTTAESSDMSTTSLVANASAQATADPDESIAVESSVIASPTSIPSCDPRLSVPATTSTVPMSSTTAISTTSIGTSVVENTSNTSASSSTTSTTQSGPPSAQSPSNSSLAVSADISSNNSSVIVSTTKQPINTTSISTTSTEQHNSTSMDTPSRMSSSNTTKSSSSTAPQAQPSTQESFFKSISKRLQQLESNSTLSLQYIEQQSRILRDAFSKVEKRQISTTTSFLANLNNTVMAELAGFRQAYDQLWQSTVIELEGQREQHQREMTALSSRLTLVVDELVWQKRMGIVQSTLLLLCIGLVLFARPGNTWEASLAQQMMSRSQAAFRSGTASDSHSPASGRSPVSLFRRKIPLWRKDGKSAEHFDDASLSPAPDSPAGLESPTEGSPLSPALLYGEDEAALADVSIGHLSI